MSDKLSAVLMKGYNKAGENTYPNLMADIAGNNFHLSRRLDTMSQGAIDKEFTALNFTWKYFEQMG